MALKVLLCTAALYSVAGGPVEKIWCSPQEVTAEVGSNVTLNCAVHPPRDVSNEIVVYKFNNTSVHTWRSNMDDLNGQNIIFKNRTNLFPEEMINGNVSLQLSNVNKKHKGTYSFSLKDSGLTAAVKLRVVEPPKDKKHNGGNTNNAVTTSPPTNSPSTSGPSSAAIGGGIGAFVCVVALILFIIFIYQKCKSQQHVQVQNGNKMSLRQQHQGQGPANEEQEPLHQGQGPANEEQEPLQQGQVLN